MDASRSDPRMTTSVLKVVSALLAEPAAERYGLDLVHETGLASGTLYPILLRLERAGWVEPRWEDVDPVAAGRPSRRYYKLTPLGAAEARREIAQMRQHLARAGGGPARRPIRPARPA
ncbi:MAG TPA: helix-turn-helix transcriptional regulator [Micromonosporaceae bacterium]|jgi:DNA-binding PadR family transcriptional regulator